jgi:predicted O-linked N-acetylglucosamine transferase (SPINDLY family)
MNSRPAADADEVFLQGFALHQQGRIKEAGVLYQQALRMQPKHFDALHLLGLVALQTDHLEHALGLIESAISINPRVPGAYINHGSTLSRLRRYEAAVSSYDQAIALKADSVDAYFNRANALRELKRHEEAVASYGRAIALKPDFADAYYNLGDALRDARRYQAALASYDKVIALQPDHSQAYNNRGATLAELRNYEAAAASLDKAIALNPNNAEAYNNRGNVLFELQQYPEAIASFDKAIALAPQLTNSHGVRLYAKLKICDWNALEAEAARLAERIELDQTASNPLTVLALSDRAALQRRAAEIWVHKECPPDPALAAIAKHTRHAKIRIGYFSADFRDHAVSTLTAELFEIHDRSRFEVTAFSSGANTRDPMRKRLQAAFDRFVDVSTKADQEVALLARSLEIDIAVDLGGFTMGARPRIFALRAAPLQVSYLGYPGTMGADYIDYLIGDSTVIPRASQQHYREKIIYLPHSFLVNDSKREVADRAFSRLELGLPPTGFVFCCFNNSYKITPSSFDSWTQILRRVERSVLWLSEDNATAVSNLCREAGRRGVGAERLIFAKRLPSRAEHLARHRAADLFLDTLPYNAHTTASDALWAGLPVLTRIGESFAGRVAASLLHAMGLPELITASAPQYEELAVNLAADPQRLASMRQKLADNRLQRPLFDTRLFAKHLEAAYEVIYERYRSDRPPAHVYVQTQRQ